MVDTELEPEGPDDLASMLTEDADADVVEGLADLLEACDDLHRRRLALALSVEQVATRCGCETASIAWIDEGDLGAPAEVLAYYAAAVGARVRVTIVT